MKKMKKEIIIPVLTAVVGIFIGYLLFSGSSKEEVAVDTVQKKQIWTCSMHPQIRRDAPGDCPICGMDLIPLDENASDNPLVFEMSEDAVRIAQIETTVIGSDDASARNLTLSGRLTSDETTASSLVSHIPGRIEKLYISFTGDRVYKGQKIAQIYSSNLISAQGELLEAYKVRESHPELLQAAKQKLRYWKISDAEIEQIIKKGAVQEYFDIRAEHTGVITKRRVNVGDHLMQGGVLFDVQNLNSLWAVFDVYEKDLSTVHIGDEIYFMTPALKGQNFSSKVVFIDPLINPATRTASVRLEVSNAKQLLKPDMFITGTLHDNKQDTRKQLYVPKSAVLWTGERSVVYVQLPGTKVPSFEYREVLLGASSGQQYEVLEGLSQGEEVVTNGAFVIDASAQLNNRSSMMNRSLLGVGSNASEFSTPDFSSETPKAFKMQLKAVIAEYLVMKDALVASENEKVKASAEKLRALLNKVDMKLVDGKAHLYWMEKGEALKGASQKILTAKNIDLQRASFDELSVALISAAQAFGITDEQLYIQYCPMADNNKGAYWLSKQTQIRNPYFGDQMLTCGEVKDSIKVQQVKRVQTMPPGHQH